VIGIFLGNITLLLPFQSDAVTGKLFRRMQLVSFSKLNKNYKIDHHFASISIKKPLGNNGIEGSPPLQSAKYEAHPLQSAKCESKILD